jgi:uncharacterized phage-like protein YoqJ
VLGCSLESLETVSTIRQEYPEVQVLVVDENERSKLEWSVGQEVANSISKTASGYRMELHLFIKENLDF